MCCILSGTQILFACVVTAVVYGQSDLPRCLTRYALTSPDYHMSQQDRFFADICCIFRLL